MKKILFIAIAVLMGLAGTKYYVSNQETSENSLLLQNVEALTVGEKDPFEDCPITKYNRNEKETWIKTTVEYEAGFGAYIMIKGEKVKLGIGAESVGTVFYPDCVRSDGNCCDKKHIDKAFRYA